MKTIAAIDPATTAGFAVIAAGQLITYGHSKLDSAAAVRSLADSLASYAPDMVALESAYCGVNVATGLKLAELRGRLLQVLDPLPTELVTPSQWRKTTIKPPAKSKRKILKAMAKAYVLERFGLSVTEDEADAICLACHVADRGN